MRNVNASIVVRTTPRRALDAFFDVEDLRKWWRVERALIERKPGGLWIVAWDVSKNGFKYVSAGVLTKLEPASAIIGNYFYLNPERNILGPMKLSISCSATDEGAMVNVVQDGYGHGGDWDWYYAAVTDAWPYALGLLKNHLEK